MSQSKAIRKNEFKKLYADASAAKEWELCKVYALLYYCGFRVSEVLQFAPAQILEAVKNRELVARITKTNSTREVPLSTDACSLLSVLLPRSATLYHFVKPLCVDHLTAKVNEHIRSVLGEGFSSHGFRRGYISDMLAMDSSDVGAKEVAAVVGHRSLKTTAIYYEVPKEAKRRRVEGVR